MDKKTEKNPNLTEPFMHKVRELVPHLPSYITTYNLTLSSALWSTMVIYGAYKSQKNINWLYLSAIGIFFHIITDALDGAVGRYRNTGAVKWGYFMDHTMDALIMISGLTLSIKLEILFVSSRSNLFLSALIISCPNP